MVGGIFGRRYDSYDGIMRSGEQGRVAGCEGRNWPRINADDADRINVLRSRCHLGKVDGFGDLSFCWAMERAGAARKAGAGLLPYSNTCTHSRFRGGVWELVDFSGGWNQA
jgi:hypothetical protein